MKTILAFGENRVAVIVGDGNASTLTVKNISYAAFEHDCVINGMVTDKEEFLRGISDLWNRLKLPKSGVTLSLDGNIVRTKTIAVPPKLNEKNTLEIIEKEFSASEENPENNVYSYYPSQTPGAVVGITADRAFIKSLCDTLKEIGIKVSGIYGTRISVASLISYIDEVKGKSCILMSIAGNSVTTVLIEDGQFGSLSNTRVFSDHGTSSFSAEITRTVSQLIQYQAQASRKSQNLISDVYFLGFSPEDFALCRESMNSFNLGSWDHISNARIRTESFALDFVHLGVLGLSGNKGNLYKAVVNDVSKQKEKDAVLLKILPVLALVAVFALICCFINLNNMKLQSKVDELFSYVSNESNLKAQEDYNSYLEATAELSRKKGAAEDIRKAIDSYPKATSTLNKVIAQCGEGIVNVVINSYSSDTGELVFTATGSNAEKLYEFVRALSQTGLFYNVTYSGYDRTETEGYNVNVTCTLSGTAGK